MVEAQYLEWCLSFATKDGYEPTPNFRRLFLETGRKMGAWNLVVGHWRNNMAFEVAQETVFWQIVNGISHQSVVEKMLTPQQCQLVEAITNKLVVCRRAFQQPILFLYQHSTAPQPLRTQFEMEVEKFFRTSGPDPVTWRGELYPAIRELEQQLIQENMAKAAQQPANALMPPVADMVLRNAQDGAVPVPIALQFPIMVPRGGQEDEAIQDRQYKKVAQGMLSPNLIAPATHGNQVGPMLSSFELARTLVAPQQSQQTAGEFAPTNNPKAPFSTMSSVAHQFGSLTGTSTPSSSSGTHSSPPRAPKRPRDRKRDWKTKGLRSKVTDACERTPINLVYAGSPEFARRQQEAVNHCMEAEVYQHPVYKQVPHLFHLHVFDPTAAPAQLPQFKKNVMLDTRQLYRTWNFKANKVIQGSSNKKWDEWQETKDRRLGEWHQVTEMLAKEKERQILAGFIALNPPQKTRNYGRKSHDGAGPAPPMDAVRLVGFGGQVIGSDGVRGDQLA
ncbi:hypothetical protein CAEBREN_20848 [Caenorhabditis brenneri]|uniref:Uncharacterized protein n=1 Tax=Caenorhabditis brenneri TaxID=135651 RepID=G0MMS4_CAEBE|nr:hypothetical protein CAEBREN_20848 [Caenorhabditis brenneri]